MSFLSSNLPSFGSPLALPAMVPSLPFASVLDDAKEKVSSSLFVATIAFKLKTTSRQNVCSFALGPNLWPRSLTLQ